MIDTGLFFSLPFFWIFMSALFSGAGISRATRSVNKSGNPEKAQNRKWIQVCICLSFSVICAMGSLLVPGVKELTDIKYSIVFLIFLILSFFGFRFKKAFGIPFLFVFFFSLFVIFLFFQALTSFTGETEIAQIHMFSVKENRMTMEIVLPDNRSEVLEMEGRYFGPVVKVIILEDFLVFFGVKTWYRFIGFVSFTEQEGSEIPKIAESFEFHEGLGISQNIYKFAEENEGCIPGIKSAQGEIIQKRAKKLTSYSIRVQNNGGVVVEEIE